MSHVDALATWSNACEQIGIRWFLYRETLLCAEGLGKISSDIDCGQIAVLAQDLGNILKKVWPLLPEKWNLSVQKTIVDQQPLTVMVDEKPVLQIDVLWPIEVPERLGRLKSKLDRLCRKTRKIERNRKLLWAFLSNPNKNYFGSAYEKAGKRAFDEIVRLAGAENKDACYYTDVLTNKNDELLEKSWLAADAAVICQEGKYPVFAGCRAYLEQCYGDYLGGLTDEIGVGLTLEEKEELKKHQERCKEALAFLQELALQYKLEYYLLAGSVLGCARDGGFIPWDDDIDVGIRVEKLEPFEALVKEQLPLRLPKGFELMQPGADHPYPRMFSKICYEGRCCIDLWPLVPTYTGGMRAKFTWYFAKIITKAHYYKIGYKVTRFLKIVKPMCLVLSDKQVMALAKRNEFRYAKKKTDAYINLYSIYKREKETIKRKWLDTPATLKFDGLEVPVVGCTDEYLKHMYGDYMIKPAAWKRASRHVERFSGK